MVTESQSLRDRITELEAAVFGLDSVGGIMRTQEIHHQRLSEMENRVNTISIKLMVLIAGEAVVVMKMLDLFTTHVLGKLFH